MKEIIGKSKIMSSSLPKRITVDSIAKETPVDIAEAFNNFFYKYWTRTIGWKQNLGYPVWG